MKRHNQNNSELRDVIKMPNIRIHRRKGAETEVNVTKTIQ